MRRAFLIVTAGVGAALGWGLAMGLTAVATPSVALAIGTVASSLFVGAVFDGLRRDRQ